jgi:hypothetical protein
MSDEVVQQIKEPMGVDPVFSESLFTSPLQTLQAYDLTEEELQGFVVPNFSRIIEKQLAGISYPRSEDAFVAQRNLGVQALLSLSEEGMPEELLSKYQMEWEHLSVTDFTAPAWSR